MMAKGGRGGDSRQVQSAISFAFSFSGAIVMGYVIGGALDRRWHTSPWLTMVGIVLGATAALTGLVRQQSRNGSVDKED